MSKPFGQYASLKNADDGYKRSQFSGVVFEDRVTIWDNHLTNTYVDTTYFSSNDEHPIVWKQEGDTRVMTQKYRFLKHDQETKYVFKMANGEWEFTFAWYDHNGDQVDVTMRRTWLRGGPVGTP